MRPAALDLADALDESGEFDTLIALQFVQEGAVVSDNLVTFVRPKHLTLNRP